MQDPICAMKILRRPKFRVPNVTWCVRNCARPGGLSTATWLIPSIHNLRQTQAVSSLYGPTIGGNSALVSAAVAVQWNERVSTYVC
jgi:hypothetical protein